MGVCRKGILSSRGEEEEEDEETDDKYMRACQQNCPRHHYLKLLKLKIPLNISLILTAQRLRSMRVYSASPGTRTHDLRTASRDRVYLPGDKPLEQPPLSRHNPESLCISAREQRDVWHLFIISTICCSVSDKLMFKDALCHYFQWLQQFTWGQRHQNFVIFFMSVIDLFRRTLQTLLTVKRRDAGRSEAAASGVWCQLSKWRGRRFTWFYRFWEKQSDGLDSWQLKASEQLRSFVSVKFVD